MEDRFKINNGFENRGRWLDLYQFNSEPRIVKAYNGNLIPLHEVILQTAKKLELERVSKVFVDSLNKYDEGVRNWFSKDLVSAIRSLSELVVDNDVKNLGARKLAGLSEDLAFGIASLPRLLNAISKEWRQDEFALQEKDFKERIRSINNYLVKYPIDLFKNINSVSHFFKNNGAFKLYKSKPKWDKLERTHYQKLRGIAGAYNSYGNTRLALKILGQLIKMQDANRENYMQRALINLDLGQHEAVIDDCTEMIKINPNDAKALFMRGVLTMLLKSNYIEGEVDFKEDLCRAISLKEGYARDYLDLFVGSDLWSTDEVYQFIKAQYGEETVYEWQEEIKEYEDSMPNEEELKQQETTKFITNVHQDAHEISWEDKMSKLRNLAFEIENKENLLNGDKNKLIGVYRHMQALLNDKQEKAFLEGDSELVSEILLEIKELSSKIEFLNKK